MVFERDNYICQRCGSEIKLHCHHIDPVSRNPVESADLDNCVTLCEGCHELMHTSTGCKKYKLRCEEKN
jgi:5-methylcytosine-specific restriction endonuclease McrA